VADRIVSGEAWTGTGFETLSESFRFISLTDPLRLAPSDGGNPPHYPDSCRNIIRNMTSLIRRNPIVECKRNSRLIFPQAVQNLMRKTIRVGQVWPSRIDHAVPERVEDCAVFVQSDPVLQGVEVRGGFMANPLLHLSEHNPPEPSLANRNAAVLWLLVPGQVHQVVERLLNCRPGGPLRIKRPVAFPR